MYPFIFIICGSVFIGGTLGCIGGVIFLILTEYSDYSYAGYSDSPRSWLILRILFILIVSVIGYIFGIILIPITLEIFNYVIPATILYVTIDIKIPNEHLFSSYLWSKIIQFTLKSKTKKDRLLRVISANRIIASRNTIGEYLKNKETEYETKFSVILKIIYSKG